MPASEARRGDGVPIVGGGTTTPSARTFCVLHQGTVASLRVGKEDRTAVTSGECGILLDPLFHGYVEREVEAEALETGALRPVETVALPYLVVG